MSLRRLSTQGFRNLQPQTLAVPPGVLAIVGPNGAGKTSLLEAVAVLGNLLSFRPGSPASWVQRGARGFSLAGTLLREGTTVELRQDARLGRGLGRALFRGARRLDPPEYLEIFPVAALSAHDRLLVWGPPEERRRFIDRTAFFLKPATLPVAQRYKRILKQRNALLVSGGDERGFEAFEQELSVLGARLVELRLGALSALEHALEHELSTLEWSLPTPHLSYNSSDGVVSADPPTLASQLYAELTRRRREERMRGHTIVGPHRHDIRLTVAGSPARETLSAGQGKLLATACKLAAVTVFEQVRGRMPTVIFDDVDAELDSRVLERILARLSAAGQALVSSAHEEMLLARLPGASVWRVREGVVDTGDAREKS